MRQRRAVMADKTMETLKLFVLIIGAIAVIASPIIAVTVATEKSKAADTHAKEAKLCAEQAKQIAEQNARDFAFFKGEVNAKLDNLTKGQDRMLEFMSSLERAE